MDPDREYKVIILEDNDLIRRMTIRLLRRNFPNINVVLDSPNSEEALPLIEEGNIDLLIQDTNRPGIDGIDMAYLARKRDHSLKILFITAVDFEPMHERTNPTGYLQKPAELEEYVAKIRNVLSEGIRNGIYVLAAPPGFGKSTIAKNLKLEGVRILPKLTTRKKRGLKQSEETKHIDEETFMEMYKDRVLFIPHEYAGFKYAISSEELTNVLYSMQHHKTPHVYPTTHIPSARAFKRSFPGRVRLVVLQPPKDFAGFGLEKRLKHLGAPSRGFDSIDEEIEFYAALKSKQKDTYRRLRRIRQEEQAFQVFAREADLVVRTTDLRKATNRIAEFIYNPHT